MRVFSLLGRNLNTKEVVPGLSIVNILCTILLIIDWSRKEFIVDVWYFCMIIEIFCVLKFLYEIIRTIVCFQ